MSQGTAPEQPPPTSPEAGPSLPKSPSSDTTSQARAATNPLQIDVEKRVALLERNLKVQIPQRGAALLARLSDIADGPIERIARDFAPVLLDIVARWLDSSEKTHERLIALSHLAEPRPDIWPVITSYLEIHFPNSPLHSLPDDDFEILLLLKAYYRLLTADPDLAKRLDWSTAPLHALRSHKDARIRCLAVHVLSKIRGWSETKRSEMLASCFDTSCVRPTLPEYLLQPGYEFAELDAERDFPLKEASRVRSLLHDTGVDGQDDQVDEGMGFASADLSPRTAVVGNQLFLRHPATPVAGQRLQHEQIHVPTGAMNSAMDDIAPHLSRCVPVLITAPPSAGKTHIVQHLSTTLYPSQLPTSRILTIPLADTTIDVKALIGTYVSSPTKPGTFEWMEGALAKAVRAGRWVVFEDIDKASLEMLVTISGITKSLHLGRVGRRATLQVPGREDIEAGNGFAVFATRTVRSDAHTPPTFFGHQDFQEVHLSPPTDEDILQILSAQFPRLPADVTPALVGVWHALRPLSKSSGQVKARDIGLRDLEKWCARVERALPPPASLAALEKSGAGAFGNAVFQDEVFLEAADIFLASLDNRAGSAEKRAKMVAAIADGIGMDLDRAVSLLDSRKPRLEAEKGASQVHVGRYVLETVSTKKRKSSDDDRPYALTRPSLVTLERIAAAVALAEPTLLVGETGTGKTTSVQHLANLVGKPMTALNLSTQTETSDLVGGFKPIDAMAAARSLHARWQKLFTETFSVSKAQNGTYLEMAAKALAARKWQRCAELWANSARRAVDKLNKTKAEPEQDDPRKRRKMANKTARAAVLWQSLLVDIAEFDLHHVKMKSKLVFSFVEGPLVKALRNGEWILLDEVNLASQETLEAVATILEASTASLVLTERGDVEPIPRHPDFRLFACMNPATDVGKKDLPPGLRARFTELYVPPPDDDREALIAIVEGYLGGAAAGDRGAVLDVVELYTTLKRLSAAKEIVDGSNAAPHYSMRTLARALMFAVQSAPIFGLRRGLWEGCLMAFTMSLDAESAKKAHAVLEKHVLAPMKNAKAVLAQVPTLPANLDPDDYVRFGPFWLERGPMPPAGESRYIITPSVQAKLSDLARVILTKRYPVLIQGPTSAGKTSAVEFLARQTGHRFVRINNHEHTDIQEYLGTYVTDPQTGNLTFQEGLLVTAVRQGHWIVLDELNLAPTDVLEALNRLLDDNRELVIPETQEVIKPHPNFILFATQNPPGLYAGRKVLSRAFRNRFLEVHFDDVPKDELETILCQRCAIAPTYAKRIVQVFEELRHRRQASRVFESKSSFATLRDLFRWAERGAVGYDQLATDGYMLLAERARNEEDKIVIKEVIEKIMKVSIDVDGIYKIFDPANAMFKRLPFNTVPESGMVWTRAMQRLFALVSTAAAHDEPVLLVGETGCGKTSVCEVLAAAFSQKLVGINCHQNMETADLLGSQRPVRNRHERRSKVLAKLAELGISVEASATEDDLLNAVTVALKAATDDAHKSALRNVQREVKKLSALFEWVDGPLIHAMVDGDLLLLDEVSLADDSVLERLNSVLEPGRTLVLAEKGGVDIDDATIVANPRFHVVATMNPGGDFGKKELSPALRNRFTEIWVPALGNRDDLLQIIAQSWKHEELQAAGPLILDFMNWFGERIGDSSGLGLRDILAWVNFSNQMFGQGTLGTAAAFHHGGQMVFTDGLESLPQVAGSSLANIAALRQECLLQLDTMAAGLGDYHTASSTELVITPQSISIGGFGVPRGPVATDAKDEAFRFEAPSTALNAMRVLRGCQLPKAILLEGSPGVGKTSLVSALAKAAGFKLQRINLSDQTDLIDLFGSDLPVEGGAAGEFQWRDAAFLDAMQKGDWVLLDEMNLASQTVLEGLNAVLDHRGTVYIPELGRSFDRHPDFRVFAAQNPLTQGGGRKGLPKSFLNRFTKVYLQEHTPDDLLLICRSIHDEPEVVQKMIAFNEEIREGTMVTRTIGREGSPWEFNLRDLFRWFGLLAKRNGLEMSPHPVEHLATVYLQRFRNSADRAAVATIFERVFGIKPAFERPAASITPKWFKIGHSAVPRGASATVDIEVPHHQLPLAESILKAVEMGWLVILAGDNGRGKRDLLRAIAAGAGTKLGEFAMHPGVDTSEILGTFEQQDRFRALDKVTKEIRKSLEVTADTHPIAVLRIKEIKDARVRCNDPRSQDAVGAFVATAQSILADLDAAGADTKAIAAALAEVERTPGSATGFAWVDGALLDAIRNGGWFLVSDANLCSASVLDRLNSLCEIDGVLVMSEKGSASGTPEVITPHKDFRLFMTYDPRMGELSRAMRNRGVELYVDAPDTAPETALAIAGTQTADTFVLAEDSLLRASNRMSSQWPENLDKEGVSYAPYLANEIASASRSSFEALRSDCFTKDFRFKTLQFMEETPELAPVLRESAERLAERGIAASLIQELPFDPATDPNTGAVDFTVYRVLLLWSRMVSQLHALLELIRSANGKSVLAKSAARSRSGGGGRRKSTTGDEVYPFLMLLQDNLPKAALQHFREPSAFTAAEATQVLSSLLIEHTRTETFDYSSIQLLATWLGEQLARLNWVEAQDAVAVLAKTTQITKGLGQAAVWTLFRSGQLPRAQKAQLTVLAERLDGVSDAKLKIETVAALSTAAHNLSEEVVSELSALIDTLPRRGADAESTAADTPWTNAAVARVIELDLLNAGQATWDSPTLALLASAADARPMDILDLQGTTLTALSAWLLHLWQPGSPGKLFQPVQLPAALRFSRTAGTPLAQIDAMDDALAFSTRTLLWQAGRSDDRAAHAWTLALRVLTLVLGAFGVSVVNGALQRPDKFETQEDEAAFAYLETAFGQHLASPLAEGVTLTSVGKLWFGIGRLVIDLFVTNVPIDPGVRRVLMGEVIAQQLDHVTEELGAIQYFEKVVKGVADSARVASLQMRAANLEAEEEALGPRIDRDVNATRLGHLFNEVYSFFDDIFSAKAIDSLLSAIASNYKAALAREEAFQLASMAFVQRLSTGYADLEDLARPIVTAVLCAKFGIRLLARDLELQTTQASKVVEPVVSFPTVAGYDELQNLPAGGKEPSAASMRADLLVALSHAQEATTSEQRIAHIPGIVSGLDRLYAAWSAIRLREQQEAQEAESLFRIRKTDIEVLSDEELMEKEFAALFPTFGDIMEDEDEQKEKEVEEKPSSAKAKFGASQISAFHKIVLGAFGEKPDSITSTLKQTVDDILSSLNPVQFRETLDSKSLAFQTQTLHHRHTELKTSSAQSNFYFSPNECEVRKAYVILDKLRARLDVLVAEWPDQMVLQHIRERVLRVLNLDVRSPVAKVLAALEQLLLHTDDWEPYANRENSLKSYQHEISNLIVAWRRLELSAWVRLLDDQMVEYVAKDDEFTLRLYGAFVHGIVDSDDPDKYLATVQPVLSEYLNMSTLGAFQHRLSVLSAFQRMSAELGKSDAPAAAALAKVAALLHNVIGNAKLFVPRIQTSLEQQRKVIDKAVKDFVKLASWKDINVFALKASAAKSHKQLHKNIRKFREVLMQPVAPILGDPNAICPQETVGGEVQPHTGHFDVSELSPTAIDARKAVKVSVPPTLANLPTTLARYSAVQEKARAVTTTSESSQMEGLATDIIETAEMLRKCTPAFLTKENTKAVNNLTSRKRKAFSDLLKTLRACGFSQSVPADKLQRQQSTTWISGLPSLIVGDLPDAFDTATLAKVEEYHHRQSVLMTAMRAAFNGHSPDIASQDLGRAMGYVESLYAASLGEHGVLASQLKQLSHLSATLRRLHHIAHAQSVAGGAALVQALSQAELNVCRIHDALREVEVTVRAFRELQGVQPGTNDLSIVHEFRQEVGLLVTALENALSSARSADWALLGKDEASLVERTNGMLTRLQASCEARAAATPEIAHLFTPIADLASSMVNTVSIKSAKLPAAVWKESDELIQVILVAAQGIDLTTPPARDDDEYANLPASFSRQNKSAASLRVGAVVERLDTFSRNLASTLAGKEAVDAPALYARVLPFVEALAETYACTVASHLVSTKSVYKLTYVVGRVVLDIAQKGFCKPQEESKDDSADGEDGEVEGTGLGAGSGDKNVSSEIKKESQVEGLQGEEEEEQEQQGGDDDDDDDAVSMENDFEGKLEDGKEKDDGDESGDEEDEDELDDHVGDVDPLDPGAVDEKFWDEEKEEGGEEEKDGREDLMNQKNEENGEAELSAKDGAKEDKKKDKDEKKGEEPEANDTQHDDTPQVEQGEGEGEEGEEEGDEVEEFEEHENPEGEAEGQDPDNEGQDMQQQDNVAAEEGDKLDLPEDLELDGDEEEGQDETEAFDDEDIDMGEPEGQEDNGVTSDHGEQEEDDAPAATGITEDDAAEEQEESANQNLDMSASNDATAQESAAAGQGQGAVDKEEAKEKDGDEEMEGADEEAAEAEEEAEADGATQSAPQGGGGADEQETTGPTDSTGAAMPDQGMEKERSLGDIMEEIKRRRDEILAQTEREEETRNQDAQEQAPGQVEYVHEGQEDDGQALGAARDEQQKLEDLHIVDEEEGETDKPPAMEDDEEPEDVDMAEASTHAQQPDVSVQRDKDAADNDLAAEKALTQAEIGGSAPMASDAMDIDGEGGELAEKMPEDEEPEDDAEVDLTISAPAEDDGAEDLWRQYASLTSDLSYALCEQLRLILEPTLATRLQGDFRTGKRLNMRKIIPYIASEYTKDKIWLRRTKPSRREYQVLLSLDDSRSMAESHSVHLAYQTLALVSQALTKLEVGQVSIARFGESVDILHDFGTTFSDADGAKVMRAFKFDQHRTDVAALVERTLSYLAEARQKQVSQSAPDLWQLQIIISDGVCQDHAKLKTLLRRALEERVMIVFLIVDQLGAEPGSAPASAPTSAPASGASTPAPAHKPSILSMQTVNYTNVNGEMKLEMQRYLDTFPFEFYVVLRDVEALPGVLSDTLRQWMARVSQSQE